MNTIIPVIKKIASVSAVLVLFSAVVFFSWIRSDQVYTGFLTVYYRLFHSGEYTEYISELKHHYDEGNRKEFERLSGILLRVWPEKKEAKRLSGRYFIENGEPIEGVNMLIDSLAGTSADTMLLADILPVLHQYKLYGDILAVMDRYDYLLFRTNGSILFYYGHALFEKGAYKKALDVLSRVRSLSIRPEYLQTLALCYEKLSETASGKDRMSYLENAALYIEMAYKQGGGSTEIHSDYIRILGKTGQFEKAARAVVK